MKAFLEIKGIDYTPVLHEAAQPNEALMRWTGQNSAPVAIFGDERPRSHWSEMLMLTERLQPAPSLIPSDEEDRALFWGICHTICGEDGFGWSARIVTFDAIARVSPDIPLDGVKHKYLSGESLDHALTRLVAIMDMLARRLKQQKDAGRGYFVGNAMSAADLYWTVFSNMLAPMDHAINPMPDHYREWCTAAGQALGREIPPVLIDHRDEMLRQHFPHLPFSF